MEKGEGGNNNVDDESCYANNVASLGKRLDKKLTLGKLCIDNILIKRKRFKH